jgi:hypothetical protein
MLGKGVADERTGNPRLDPIASPENPVRTLPRNMTDDEERGRVALHLLTILHTFPARPRRR